jgi:serine/threonine protein kinase/Flp pilus assembly protein TadD
MTSSPRGISNSTVWHQPHSALQEELALLLDGYASALEEGREQDAEELLRRYPQLAQQAGGHLESLRMLCRATRDVNSVRPEPQPAATPSDHQLGDYRIEREIGRGGMGIVYAARQVSLGRMVALKVLPFASVLDQQQVTRFHNEAQAAASLHHPHIVPVFGVGCERGVHYYSMQWIDGQSLDQAIAELRGRTEDVSEPARTGSTYRSVPPRSSSLSDGVGGSAAKSETPHPLSTIVSIRSRNFVHAAVNLMIHVADALDYAHNQGVVHRDIKPSNLLLDASGKIWVTDFGLARCQGNPNLTVNGDLIGTARYMSPEQAAGRLHEIDHRADIYAIGVTLYELLTLRYAYDEANREQLLRAIQTRDPISPRRWNSAISVDLETIVSKAMAKSRDERYATAKDLADDLRRYLEGKPTLARRPSWGDRLWRYAVRRRRMTAAVAAGLLATTIGTGIGAALLHHQRTEKDRAAQQARLHLQQAHQVVHRFGTLMSDHLRDVAGTEGVRAELLDEAARYYRDFVDYAEQEGELQLELPNARLQLGAIYERLGNETEAEREYRTAVGYWQQRLLTHGDDSRLRHDLAVGYNNVATLYKTQGRWDEAVRDFQRALAAVEPVLGRDATSRNSAPVELLVPWSLATSQLGLIRLNQGDNRQADDLLERATLAMLDAHRRAPDDRQIFRQLIDCRNNWVALLVTQRPRQAESMLREAITEVEQAQAMQPPGRDDLEQRQRWELECALSLATLRNNLVPLLQQKGDLPEAQRLAELVVEQLENSPHLESSVTTQEQLAIAHNNSGRVLTQLGKRQAGTDALQRAEDLLRKLVLHAPDRASLFGRLGGVLHNQALLADQAGRHEAAVEMLSEAIACQSQAIKLAPLNQEFRQFLVIHRENLDSILQAKRLTSESTEQQNGVVSEQDATIPPNEI